MARQTIYQDDKLESYNLPNFSGGYNSYTQSRSLVTDKEIPTGQNVVLDDNGSATKRLGSSRYGGQIASGKAIMGMDVLKTASHNKIIVAAGTAWYHHSSGSTTALTGATFTDAQPTDFTMAAERLYGANNTDALSYTADGSTITQVTGAAGNVGRWPVSYAKRLYMTNASNPDRVYYSNPYGITIANQSVTYDTTYFGTFDTDLTQAVGTGEWKNAGFIVLLPGAGLEITRLQKVSTAGTDYIYAYTKRHGVWRIQYVETNASTKVVIHSITQIITSVGAFSGRSVVTFGNDQWFYGGDNFYTLGEVANYQNIRVSTKSGRIRSEVNSIALAGKPLVTGGFFKDKIYFAYMTGTYNDRIIIYDAKFGSWSTPIVGINTNVLLEFEEDNGTRRFLSGSSNSSDSYVYELETGTNDQSTAISANFETKSTDCALPGLVKRFAFIDVFVSLIYGVLTYEVFIDETSSLTGSLQTGSSSSTTSGVGSQPIGNFPVGGEYAGTATGITRSTSFRIDCSYTAGKKISVKFTNNNASEQFKIDSLKIWFLPGSIYET